VFEISFPGANLPSPDARALFLILVRKPLKVGHRHATLRYTSTRSSLYPVTTTQSQWTVCVSYSKHRNFLRRTRSAPSPSTPATAGAFLVVLCHIMGHDADTLPKVVSKQSSASKSSPSPDATPARPATRLVSFVTASATLPTEAAW
jgi:hypothetical protein